MTADSPPMTGDFTQEPRESDLVMHRAPIYTEEPGIKAGKPSSVTLAPCTTCGVPVITGITDHGEIIPVEPQTTTYALLWRSGERHPRLKPGRGYPAHQCQR
jgi:hypothetical protein